MNEHSQRQLDNVSLSDLLAIDVICNEFEREWQKGRSAQFEDYLSKIDKVHAARLAYELIRIELEYRACVGDEVVAVNLKRRAPGFEAMIDEAIRDIGTSNRVVRPVDAAPSPGNSAMCYASLFRHVRKGSSKRKRSPGDSVGKFQLVEQIGSGGFGAVWKAVDSELNRIVALKIPHERGFDEEFQRFEREARSLAKLSHPNIVRILSVERDDDLVFIVTDFIVGISLAKALDGPSLDFSSSADLCATIAETLQFAHDSCIIHRDVKPANILLDLRGNPYLTDFGLARDLGVDASLTETGNVFGTPAYMSPEQARGHGNRADARSDIYSLGVVLFQLLTGDVPFRGSYQVLVNSILHDEPKNPRDLDRKIPIDLDTICRKCLEKDPARRYASAALLAKDLRAWLEGRPISARPISRTEQGVRWCKRQPLAASLLASILILSAACFSTVTWLWRSAVGANQDRRLERVNALLTAEPSSVGLLLRQIASDVDSTVEASLRKYAEDPTLAPYKQLRAQEALLSFDIGWTEKIVDSLLGAPVDEVPHVVESLKAVPSVSQSAIQGKLVSASDQPGDLLRLSAALVRIKSTDSLLAQFAPQIAHALCEAEPASVVHWSRLLVPMASTLRASLLDILAAEGDDPPIEVVQAIATLFENSPKDLLDLLPRVGADHFRSIVGLLDGHQEEVLRLGASYVVEAEKANEEGTITSEEAKSAALHCLAAFSIDSDRSSMKLLRPEKSGAVRHHLIVLPARIGLDPTAILDRLSTTTDPYEASGYLLALGQFASLKTAQRRKDDIVAAARSRFVDDPDPGVHSAAEWLLRQWLGETAVAEMSKPLESLVPLGSRRWFIHPEGITFLVFAAEPLLVGGGPASMHRFAIASSEVTCQQIARWSPSHMSCASSRGPSHPAGLLSGIDARAFCDWLSAKDLSATAISNDELLGTSVAVGTAKYRLPTDSEWTFVARSGTSGASFVGSNKAALLSYAWLAENAVARVHETRSLMPNPFGVYDVIGNVNEWVQPESISTPFMQILDFGRNASADRLLVRGQNIHTALTSQSIHQRTPRIESEILQINGFRVARSLNP